MKKFQILIDFLYLKKIENDKILSLISEAKSIINFFYVFNVLNIYIYINNYKNDIVINFFH